MKRVCLLLLVVLSVALPGCHKDPGPVLAQFEGGEIRTDDIGLRTRLAVAGATPERERTLLEEAVQQAAFRRIVLRDAPPAQPSEAQIAAAASQWFSARDWTQPEIDDEVVADYYREHEAWYRKPEYRQVSHLYIASESGEDARRRLTQVQSRLSSMQTFAELAAQHSESENREFGGALGWMPRGVMSRGAEKVVFELPEGGVSEPIAVPGGFALFHVGDILPERHYPLEDMRSSIARALLREAVAERAEEMLEGESTPDNALQLDETQLRAALASHNAGAVVLRMGDLVLTVDDLLEQLDDLVGRGDPRSSPLPMPGPMLAWRHYRGVVAQYHAAWLVSEESGGVAGDEERHYEQVVDRLLARWVAEHEQEAVKVFFADNEHLYQQPARFALRLAAWQFADAQVAAERAAEVTRQLNAEPPNAERILQEHGFSIVDQGWVTAEWLLQYPEKVATYLALARDHGHSPVFRTDRRLQVLLVDDYAPPGSQSFSAVADQVRSDFRQRFEQEIFTQLLADTLKTHRFGVDADALSHWAREWGAQHRSRSRGEVDPG